MTAKNTFALIIKMNRVKQKWIQVLKQSLKQIIDNDYTYITCLNFFLIKIAKNIWAIIIKIQITKKDLTRNRNNT